MTSNKCNFASYQKNMYTNVQTKGVKRKHSLEIEPQNTSAKTARICDKMVDTTASNVKTTFSCSSKFSANKRLKEYRKNLQQRKNVLCKVHTLIPNSCIQSKETVQTKNISRTHQRSSPSARMAIIHQGAKLNTNLNENTAIKKVDKYTIPKKMTENQNVDNISSVNNNIVSNSVEQKITAVTEPTCSSKQNETYDSSIEDWEMDWSPVGETEVITDVSLYRLIK